MTLCQRAPGRRRWAFQIHSRAASATAALAIWLFGEYYPGEGYSVGHFKHDSDAVVSGEFLFVDTGGKEKKHTGRWEKTDDGYSYTVDKKDVYR